VDRRCAWGPSGDPAVPAREHLYGPVPASADVSCARRLLIANAVEYHADTDTMYIGGYRPGQWCSCFFETDNKIRTLARYDNWSTTRTRRWIIDLQYVENASDDMRFVKPRGFAACGDYVVVNWMSNPDALADGFERVYNANTGALVKELDEVGSGGRVTGT
jgi:hypothetical protein